jgi:hypothetical protein
MCHPPPPKKRILLELRPYQVRNVWLDPGFYVVVPVASWCKGNLEKTIDLTKTGQDADPSNCPCYKMSPFLLAVLLSNKYCISS